MNQLSFSDYSYFPSLRTRQAELKGLEEVFKEDKSKMLPLLTLGEWPKAADFSRSYSAAQKAMGSLPFIIDITQDPERLPEERKQLLTPNKGFSSWVDFCADCDNTIPVALFTKHAKIRDITLQAKNLEKIKGKLALRVRNFELEPTLVISALSAIDNPLNAIIFLDAQYITKKTLDNKINKLTKSINFIKHEYPEVPICVLGTSYPRRIAPHLNEEGTEGSIPILEKTLYDLLNEENTLEYGDHASIHSTIYDDQPGFARNVQRIDYPLIKHWNIQRRRESQPKEGYRLCAEATVHKNPCINKANSWGEQMIIEAVNEPYGAAPQSWISVRVNIHLTKQVRDCFTNKQEGFE